MSDTKITPETPRPTVVLVGAGRIAQRHLKAIDRLQRRGLLELVAVVDSDLDRAKAAATSRQAKVFSSLSEALRDMTPTLVAVTSPSATHAALAREALEANAHVVVEKPMALRVPDAEALVKAADQAHRTLTVCHLYRYMALAPALKAIVDEKSLGDVLHGRVVLQWGHDQAYYDGPPARGTYAAEGGCLLNQGVHAVDLVQWLLGRVAHDAIAMIARQTHEMEVEDLAMGVLRFPHNTLIHVQATTSTDPKRHRAWLSLVFERGTLDVAFGRTVHVRVRGHHGARAPRGVMWRTFTALVKAKGLDTLAYVQSPYLALYEDTLRAVATQTSPLADGCAGVNALKAVLALYRAARERQCVTTASTVAFPLTDMVGVPAIWTRPEPISGNQSASPNGDTHDTCGAADSSPGERTLHDC